MNTGLFRGPTPGIEETMKVAAPRGIQGALKEQSAGRFCGAVPVAGAAPTTGYWKAGDVLMDPASYGMWICYTSGSPGSWQFVGFPTAENAVSVTSNAGTCSSLYPVNKFVNSSAATMTITLPTSGPVPVAGQPMVVKIYDASAVAQTITWSNTENSSISAPTTSNASTTLPVTVSFMWNASTSLWRCVGYA
jgi:hypothetical protein